VVVQIVLAAVIDHADAAEEHLHGFGHTGLVDLLVGLD
jgi:hypothetical protein